MREPQKEEKCFHFLVLANWFVEQNVLSCCKLCKDFSVGSDLKWQYKAETDEIFFSYFLIRQSHLIKLIKLLLSLHLPTPLLLPPFVRAGSHFVARVGHKLMDSSDPQISVFRVSMAVGMCHHVWPNINILLLPFYLLSLVSFCFSSHVKANSIRIS